jgi:DNA repair exonuclease SbcCD ATPase subunit
MGLDGTTESPPNNEQSRSSPMRNQPGTVRRVSSSLDVSAAVDMPRAATLSPTNENQWSSAVGYAATTGKSGRVIERLMADNDRLKRETELQTLRAQDAERSLETVRPQLEALRAENENLNHANNMDGAMLARRDRKIEQLKEEIATERSRREASETLARRLERQMEQSQDTAKRDLHMAYEEAKHATTHANILEQSHRQLALEYKQRAEKFRKDLAVFQAQRKSDDERITRYILVSDQMRSEVDRADKAHAELTELLDAHMKATEEWQAGLSEVANHETSKMRKLSEDMETITNKMKWVMALDKSRAR